MTSLAWVGCARKAPVSSPVRAQRSRLEVGAEADDLRTGWYPDQPRLSPAQVSASDFGQLFDTAIDGQVYAQPLVANDTLLIVTETNNVYALDPQKGTIRAHRALEGSWNPDDVGCGDLAPRVGITGTPVIDADAGTAYFFDKSYAAGISGPAAYWAHAVDLVSLAERPGFPVLIQGTAANDPTVSFDATHELQRPGLLLLDGVVYATFAGHCDRTPYKGWVVGVSTAGQLTTLWTAEPGTENGAGIWQSGGAPASDRPGSFVVVTGNGPVPSAPTPGSSPPAELGQAWVRLDVQADGSLRASDFFMPYDAAALNGWDADFGSGGPIFLPDAFGTPDLPHLGLGVGKQGYFDLLDLDHLGGLAQGPGGADDVVQRLGPYGGVWSRPAAWSGGGGWMYVATASGGTSSGGSSGFLRFFRAGVDGDGRPTLALAASSADAFGFGSSPPVITSDGTDSGLVWIIWSPDGTGMGSQLRAYDAIPVDGHPTVRFTAPVGQATKFNPPGVADGRVYVAGRDGHVRGFGAPVDPALRADSVDFGAVDLGQSAERVVTFSAVRPITVSAVASAAAPFEVGEVAPALPAALAAGDTLAVNVTFRPDQVGLSGAALTAATDQGTFSTSVSGTGVSVSPLLVAEPSTLSFGATPVGRTASGAVTLTNAGERPLVWSAVTPPAPPFSAAGLPEVGAPLAPGASVTVTFTFTPTETGAYRGTLSLASNGGDVDVHMTAVSASPGLLAIDPASIDFGELGVGRSAIISFDVRNTGGTPVTVQKSKPPARDVGFTALDPLSEGTTLAPGERRTLRIHFVPKAVGAVRDEWDLTADDGSGAHVVPFTGQGVDTAAPQTGGSHGCGAAPGSDAAGWLFALGWLGWAAARRRSA